MLNPKSNRLDYGAILSAPNNYQLDFAIGTTYSLDLDALVGASIALGLSSETDSDLMGNPIFLLEALRSTSDKVSLFCESGQIHLPNKPTALHILLEDMVFQVINSNNVDKSRYASFHPKMWLLRYVNERDVPLYRFVVLSRNLTFDRSWDLSFSMDGKKARGKSIKNDALIHFIDYLTQFSTDSDKSDKIRKIMDELPFVRFKLDSNVFVDFDFIVNGLDSKYSIQNHHLFRAKSLENLMVMSPFLSKGVLKGFNSRINSKGILFTRLMSLDEGYKDVCSNFDVYSLKDNVIDGESLFEEESQDIYKHDIHAKMYVVEKQKYTDLYLGSLNASHNALNGNIEFMIRLGALKRRFNIDKLLKEIFNGDGADNPFQLVDLSTIRPQPDEGSNLNLVIKGISRLKPTGEVISNGKCYDINLDFNNININDADVKISPLLSNKEVEISKSVTFEKLHKIQLSEFFIVTVTGKDDNQIKRIIKIPLRGMPENRQKDIVNEVINDKTAFIRYVAFLLGDEYVLSSIEAGMNSDEDINISYQVQLPELYEKMLKAALYAPEKFHELEFLLETLSEDDVIPEGFEELYNTFMEVIE